MVAEVHRLDDVLAVAQEEFVLLRFRQPLGWLPDGGDLGNCFAIMIRRPGGAADHVAASVVVSAEPAFRRGC